MGNNVEVNYPKPSSYLTLQRSHHPKTKLSVKGNTGNVFIMLHKTETIRLSALRGWLSSAECFYALSALVQQYYSLFKLYRKVVVSDHLCLVNQLGQLKVDFCIDGPETSLLDYDQVTHSFVTTISQIVAMVQRLAAGRQLQQSESVKFRRDLVARVQSCHQDEQATYHSVMQVITSFLEENDVRCNLLSPFLRYWKESHSYQNTIPQEQTPFLANSRTQNNPQYSQMRHSLSNTNLNQDYYAHTNYVKHNEDTITKQSHIDDKRSSLKGYSRYRHKMVRTEGENYYSAMSKQNQYNSPSVYEETSHTKFQKSAFNRISHQYTVNIQNTVQEKPVGKLKKMTKYNKSSVSVKSNQSEHSVTHNQNRRQASLHEYTQYKMEHSSISAAGKSYAKSMLQQLARSVSIRDQPSSRDHIN